MKSIYTFFALSFLALSAIAKPIIVFDAGSTGTRVYLYDVTHVDGKTTVNTLASYKPASNSAFAFPVTDVKFAMDPVAYFDHFMTEIEKTSFDHLSTHIYVHATAGVRMAKNKANIIFDMRKGIRGAVKDDTYPIIPNANIGTITVAEEAFNIWINDQYVAGKLDNNTLSLDNTLAAVEMGGASAEISVLADSAMDLTRNEMVFPHHDNDYHVYSTGYDGSGQDKALKAMVEAYADDLDERFSGCFPVDAVYSSEYAPDIIGTGDFENCSGFITDHPVNYYKKSPAANNYLLSSSGFYFTFKTLGLANQDTLQTTTNAELASAGVAFCARDWEDLVAAYPSESPSFLILYCFNSAYQHHFLSEIGVADTAKLLSVDKYNGNAMTWTLGVAYING